MLLGFRACLGMLATLMAVAGSLWPHVRWLAAGRFLSAAQAKPALLALIACRNDGAPVNPAAGVYPGRGL